MDLLVGTNNKGKVIEIGEVLADLPISLVTPEALQIIDVPDETGETYAENALQKAQFFYERAALPTIADDSGIVVDALKDELGIHTRRWGAGPDATDDDTRTKASSFANIKAELGEGKQLRDLLARFSIPSEERGITFVNGNLTAMPGMQPDLDQKLADGDRVALFHLKSMWPYQYRDGANTGSGLSKTLAEGDNPFRQRADSNH